MGEAFKMLNEKLSRSQFFNDIVGSYPPVIILISGGELTDDSKLGIDLLNKNNWFKVAVKAAVGIGEDDNINILKEFTGNRESVFRVLNSEILKMIIENAFRVYS